MIRLVSIFCLFISLSFQAQKTSKVPCSTEEYNQFSFWLGDWNVYDASGKLIGENNIVKTPNACAMQENWKSKTSPSQGTSYNFYDNISKKWHQVWVDNSGFSLFLSGNLDNNKMILRSKTQENNKGKFYHRVTWTNNTDGTVTQVWDYVNLNDIIIQEAFRGIYKKKKK